MLSGQASGSSCLRVPPRCGPTHPGTAATDPDRGSRSRANRTPSSRCVYGNFRQYFYLFIFGPFPTSFSQASPHAPCDLRGTLLGSRAYLIPIGRLVGWLRCGVVSDSRLQAAVAALSAGPVGPGDRAGSANKSLLLSTCNAAGKLLKPGYPATAADAIVARRAALSALPGGQVSTGEANLAYSVISGASFVAAIGIELPADLELSAAELGLDGSDPVVIWPRGSAPAEAAAGAAVTLRQCGKADFQLVYS